MRTPVLIGFLVLAACTPTAAEQRATSDRDAASARALDQALAGLTPGQPQTCLSEVDRRNAGSSKIGSTLIYRASRDRIYRNDMNGGCVGGGSDPIIVTSTPTGQLCRGDIARLVDRTSRITTGSCAFGDFVPYTRKPS